MGIRFTRSWVVLLIGCLVAPPLRAETLSTAFEQLGIETEPLEFHEFSGVQFKLNGVTAYVVEPKEWASGKPWIWRARFWGHEPELDLALLKRGYAVAYCDVQNLFGSPQAVARWNEFYAVAQKLQLHPKPILEGMSRGGLIVFNWAKANPQCVSAVYGDNPVCDIRTWPAKYSPDDWKRCLAAYELTESQASEFQGNPIDGLQPLADADVPVYLVLGEDDRVVPIEQNGLELARRYQALGGTVRTWRKPGQGHHPHGLHPVTPLLNELLIASPRDELDPLPLEMLTAKQRILVLGDSITYSGQYVSHLATWAKQTHQMPAERFLNVGVPSETVSGLSEPGHAGGKFPRPDLHERLARVLDHTKPDLILACYGMNDGIYQSFDSERFQAYQAGLTKLKQAADERSVNIVFFTPPVYDAHQQAEQLEYEGVMHCYASWLIAQHHEQGWHVIDLHFAMQRQLDANRASDPQFTWQSDSVHPNDAGHRAMAAAVIHGFAPEFDPAELDSPTYRAQFAETHETLKTIQQSKLEATGHRRPNIPGYRPEK
ncbi:GDSL-type esterase/lipase family protein [Aeoliella mucimassa]|uniref:Alpha/beta hydrolase family protein n=1 Tax=Aeoliella mucimassa TaxID=2527972 RepID=A0A518AW26_9BACT|nr:GDSL-type esterase/lipase family protein [Aeoliella mucimassa]QDU58924.1 Alpha/beta hydrolase family protein [Aeoliella mucimassa]